MSSDHVHMPLKLSVVTKIMPVYHRQANAIITRCATKKQVKANDNLHSVIMQKSHKSTQKVL
jgi:hypothetical protein